MRLVYPSESVLPSRTANGIHVMNMCAAMARLGREVVLLAPDIPSEEAGDPFEFYGVEPRFEIRKLPWVSFKGRALVYAALAAREARRARPDLVYGRSLPACFFAALAGLPTVFESHALTSQTRGWMFRRLIRLRAFRRLVVISDALRRDFEALFPVLKGRVLVAHDAANDPPPAMPMRFETAPVLRAGYLGHLYPGRGAEVILEMARACPWAEFRLAGGLDEDARRWRELAGDLPNLFIHGFVPPSQTEALRQACDVLLAPYQRKVGVHGGGDTVRWMSPLKIFEYMASGKAVLCSDLPVLREVMRHGENALLCAPEDFEGWIAALTRLRDDPGLRERLGRAARAGFLENHTWTKRAERVLENAQSNARAIHA